MKHVSAWRTIIVLALGLLSWAFCLWLGLTHGFGWGVAAFVIVELRAVGAQLFARAQVEGGAG